MSPEPQWCTVDFKIHEKYNYNIRITQNVCNICHFLSLLATMMKFVRYDVGSVVCVRTRTGHRQLGVEQAALVEAFQIHIHQHHNEAGWVFCQWFCLVKAQRGVTYSSTRFIPFGCTPQCCRTLAAAVKTSLHCLHTTWAMLASTIA